MSESNVLMSTIYKNCLTPFLRIQFYVLFKELDSFILSFYLSQRYTEYLLLVIYIVFMRYIFNELYAYIIYYL